MIEIKIAYSKTGAAKSYCATNNGLAMGPILSFHASRKLEGWKIRQSEIRIGSYASVSDTGYLIGMGYVSPFDEQLSIHRDAVLTRLGLLTNDLTHYLAHEKFEQKTDSENAPTIIDIEAEETWVKQFGAKDHFSVTAPRYFGRIYSNGLREGPTVTFWESGLVRTVAFWEGEHIIGTRSCFDKSGYLWCEQNFAWDGSYTGNWTNRFFGWDGTRVYLKHVDVYRFWKLFKTVDGNSVKSLFDEVGLDRYTDPLVDHLIEYRRKSEKDPWEKVGPVDTSRFLI